MRYEIRSVSLGLGARHLAGRSVGDDRFARIIDPARREVGPHHVLVLSFRDVDFATGSFFKATWHALHPDAGPAVPCAVADLSDDVRDEFSIYLRSHRLLGLEALDWTANEISLAAVHGHVEESEFSALRALCTNPGTTAPELQALSADAVSATAWTNRLNELHRQGLAFRQKAGRAWRFFPVAREVRRG